MAGPLESSGRTAGLREEAGPVRLAHWPGQLGRVAGLVA